MYTARVHESLTCRWVGKVILPQSVCTYHRVIESVDSISSDGPDTPIHVYVIHYKWPNISELVNFQNFQFSCCTLEQIIYLSSPQTFMKTFLYACTSMHEKLMNVPYFFLFLGLTQECLDLSFWFIHETTLFNTKQVHGIPVLSEHQLFNT